jgi:hypothetical protein
MALLEFGGRNGVIFYGADGYPTRLICKGFSTLVAGQSIPMLEIGASD